MFLKTNSDMTTWRNLHAKYLTFYIFHKISEQAKRDFFLIEFIAAILRDSQLSINSQQRKSDTSMSDTQFDKVQFNFQQGKWKCGITRNGPLMGSCHTAPIFLMMMMMMKCMPNEEMDREICHTLQLQAFVLDLFNSTYQVTNQHHGTILQSSVFKNYTEKDGYYV
jgi:hypothetical protein